MVRKGTKRLLIEIVCDEVVTSYNDGGVRLTFGEIELVAVHDQDTPDSPRICTQHHEALPNRPIRVSGTSAGVIDALASLEDEHE